MRYRRSSQSSWTYCPDTGSDARDTSLQATLTDLTNGRTYEFQVRAEPADGDTSEWSATLQATLECAACIQNLRQPADSGIVVAWDVAVAAGVPAVLTYKVQAGTDDPSTWNGALPGRSSGLSVAIRFTQRSLPTAAMFG